MHTHTLSNHTHAHTHSVITHMHTHTLSNHTHAHIMYIHVHVHVLVYTPHTHSHNITQSLAPFSFIIGYTHISFTKDKHMHVECSAHMCTLISCIYNVHVHVHVVCSACTPVYAVVVRKWPIRHRYFNYKRKP